MKTCTDCKEVKEISEFYKDSRYKLGVNSICKKCANKRMTVHIRKSNTGFTEEDYGTKLKEQKGCCDICGTHETELKLSLAADHCHTTKNKRGLLCIKCNLGIGNFNDDSELLKKAIKYLRKHSKC